MKFYNLNKNDLNIKNYSLSLEYNNKSYNFENLHSKILINKNFISQLNNSRSNFLKKINNIIDIFINFEKNKIVLNKWFKDNFITIYLNNKEIFTNLNQYKFTISENFEIKFINRNKYSFILNFSIKNRIKANIRKNTINSENSSNLKNIKDEKSLSDIKLDEEDDDDNDIIFKKWKKLKNNANRNEQINMKYSEIDDKNEENKLKCEFEKISEKKKDGCSICYADFIEREAKTDSCNHYFCVNCLEKWSEVNNFCPICKIKFSKIIFKNDEDIVIKQSIKFDSNKSIEESINSLDDIIEKANDYCYVCRYMNEYNFMLICDNCLQKCCHIKCLSPSLEFIPLTNWYCDFCRRDHNLTCETQDADIFNKNNKDRQHILKKIAIRRTIHFTKKIKKSRKK